MEEQARKRLDAILEDELQRGYRIKTVPENLRKQLEFECGVAIERVRFTRLNPAKRRKIAEVVQRQYHADLKNEGILSHEQILKLVQDRGEWSAAMDEEMKLLQQGTSREMGELFFSGVSRGEWTTELLDATTAFRDKVLLFDMPEDKKQELLERFDRWLEHTPQRQDEYNERFASLQNRTTYSVDVDMQRMMEIIPDLEAVDHLNTIDELRDKLHRYIKLQNDRLRLAELQLRNAKIFSESVEQRRDNTEEMGRLYFTTEQVDDAGKPIGPLVSAFEKLWDFPEEVIQWFLVEVYFFLNGIPDEAREYLQTYGFIGADAGPTNSSSGESEPSDESPAPQTSKPDTDPADTTPSASSG
jgi:hypothetical protein